MLKHLKINFLLLGFVFLLPAPEAVSAGTDLSEADYAQMRRQARNRPRRIILNNDGCDILYFPRCLDKTRENFLAQRTQFLAGKCDTLMYCPISAGQGHFTLDLPGADFLTADPPKQECHNIAGVLKERNADYFQWLIDFCRENNMEIFFSFRFNDTHDARHRPNKPSIFFSKFKDEHRRLLFGQDHTKSPRNGWWTSLDFSHSEVRERQLKLVKAVIDKYDVDGIDFDFSRYLKIFPRTAAGEIALPEEVEVMTDLMRKIRAIIDAKGRERKRPILFSVVLPDSVRLCRNLGYDMETYFKEGLVDIWQQSDGFQINPIPENVALAHRYGVKYYAFAGSPYPYSKLENGSLLNRNSPSGYAGRINNAIYGGADGLYLYNISNSSTFKLAAGTPEQSVLRYFVTGYTWEVPRGYCFSPEDYRDYSQLSAHVKCFVSPGVGKSFNVEINKPLFPEMRTTAYIDRSAGAPDKLILFVNGTVLQRLRSVGRYESFAVPSGVLKTGMNRIDLNAEPTVGEALVLFVPEKINDFEIRFFGSGNASALKQSGEKSFTVSGGSDSTGLVKRFANLEFSVIRFAFTGRLLKNSAFARLANAGYVQTIEIRPGEVSLQGTGFSIQTDTTGFHDYEIVMSGPQLSFSIDNRKVFRSSNALSGFSPDAHKNIPEAARLYGSSTSMILGVAANSGGAAEYKNIAVTVPPGSVQLANLMLECRLPEKALEYAGSSWREASGLTGKRTLDGRSLPFKTAAGKQLKSAEVSLIPGNRRSLWCVSDGKRVSAWVITSDGVRLWPGTPVGIALSDGKNPDCYRVDFDRDNAVLYRNGELFYRTGPADRVVYEQGVYISKSETPEVEEFLQEHGRRFTKAEQQIIRNGGTLARGLREPRELSPGELLSLRICEKQSD